VTDSNVRVAIKRSKKNIKRVNHRQPATAGYTDRPERTRAKFALRFIWRSIGNAILQY